MLSNIKELMMSSIVFYDHVVERYIAQSRRPSWRARLQNYRKWIESKDQFTWPLLGL